MDSAEEENPIIIKANKVQDVSMQNKVFLALGEDLILKSLTKSQDFCKTMIGTSSGAIPIYIGLLRFSILDRGNPQVNIFFLVIPTLIFLMAMLIFTIGYLPSKGSFSLNIINEIEEYHEKILKRRNTLIKLGFSFFAIGTLWASVLVIYGFYFF